MIGPPLACGCPGDRLTVHRDLGPLPPARGRRAWTGRPAGAADQFTASANDALAAVRTGDPAAMSGGWIWVTRPMVRALPPGRPRESSWAATQRPRRAARAARDGHARRDPVERGLALKKAGNAIMGRWASGPSNRSTCAPAASAGPGPGRAHRPYRVAEAGRCGADRRCEQAIRDYDPCISCSAHFVDLTVGRS